jgi:hypothetical protein
MTAKQWKAAQPSFCRLFLRRAGTEVDREALLIGAVLGRTSREEALRIELALLPAEKSPK